MLIPYEYYVMKSGAALAGKGNTGEETESAGIFRYWERMQKSRSA
jgi:hypothetical protein